MRFSQALEASFLLTVVLLFDADPEAVMAAGEKELARQKEIITQAVAKQFVVRVVLPPVCVPHCGLQMNLGGPSAKWGKCLAVVLDGAQPSQMRY